MITQLYPQTTRQQSTSLHPDQDRERFLRAQGEFSVDADIRWERRIRQGLEQKKKSACS
jgi:hypothetical protein